MWSKIQSSVTTLKFVVLLQNASTLSVFQSKHSVQKVATAL